MLDFATLSGTDVERCLTVTIYRTTSHFEGDETFNVILTTETPRVMLGHNTTVVTILEYSDGQHNIASLLVVWWCFYTHKNMLGVKMMGRGTCCCCL